MDVQTPATGLGARRRVRPERDGRFRSTSRPASARRTPCGATVPYRTLTTVHYCDYSPLLHLAAAVSRCWTRAGALFGSKRPEVRILSPRPVGSRARARSYDDPRDSQNRPSEGPIPVTAALALHFDGFRGASLAAVTGGRGAAVPGQWPCGRACCGDGKRVAVRRVRLGPPSRRRAVRRGRFRRLAPQRQERCRMLHAAHPGAATPVVGPAPRPPGQCELSKKLRVPAAFGLPRLCGRSHVSPSCPLQRHVPAPRVTC